MFHNISWKSVLCFDEHFNDLDKVVRTDIEDFNHPRKSPDKIKQCHFGKLTIKSTRCLTKWKVGLVYPMASTLASHPLDKICPHGRQIPATQPWAPIPGTRHMMTQWEGNVEGRVGWWEKAKTTAINCSTPTQPPQNPPKKTHPSWLWQPTTFHGSLHLWVWHWLAKTAKLDAVNFVKFSFN